MKKESGHSRIGYLGGCRCKKCVNAYKSAQRYMKKWEADHRKERTAYQRARMSTPEMREKRKAYRLKRRAEISEYNREYRKKNLDKINAKHKAYKEKNRDTINRKLGEYLKRRYKTDPIFRLANTLRTRINSALRRRGIGKAAKTEELIGCTAQELRIHLERQFEKGMSWGNRSVWHIDHIKPCFAFDLTDPVQQRQCFHFSNLRPLWRADNLHKSSHHNGTHHCNARRKNKKTVIQQLAGAA